MNANENFNLVAHLTEEGQLARLELTNAELETIRSADVDSTLNADDEISEVDFFDAATQLATETFGTQLENLGEGDTFNEAHATLSWEVAERHALPESHTVEISWEGACVVDGQPVGQVTWDLTVSDLANIQRITGMNIRSETFEARASRVGDLSCTFETEPAKVRL